MKNPTTRPLCEQKPKIDYPCPWTYTVIGTNIDNMIIAIETVCNYKEATISKSKSSSGGKYHSLKLSLQLENEDQRQSLYTNLGNHAAIKIVI